MTGRVVGLLVLGAVVVAVGTIVFIAPGLRTQVQEVECQMKTIGSIPADYWECLARKRVFFGHQSVGENVLLGIEELVEENSGLRLEIVESGDPTTENRSVLYHTKIGRNTRPKSKLRAFQRALEDPANGSFDIAMMKFCYVDLMYGDDPQSVFDLYRTTMSELEARYPETVFIHSTVPIEAVNSSVGRAMKQSVKSLLGKPGVVENNSVRQRFNDLIRSTYEGQGWVFDIAQAESLSPDGSVSYETLDSERVFLMDGRYSDDGGHLNELGRRRVAEELLAVLAMAANSAHPTESP